MILEKQDTNANRARNVAIQCFLHKKSFFVEGNLNYISIHQEICLIYNVLFNLNMKFMDSLNDNNSNLLIESLPYIFYGGFTIKKDYLSSFLAKLVGLLEIKNAPACELEYLQKNILFDLQMSLNLYIYFNYHEKTNYIWKILKFMYQPVMTYSTNKRDKESLVEITKLLGITSRYEAVDNVKKINKSIEEFLTQMGGEIYCRNLDRREINSIDILIYATLKAQNRIFAGAKFKKLKLDEFAYMNILAGEIDSIILNKKKIKNEHKILSPEEINFPKFTFVDANFGRYLDTPKDTPEIIKRTKIRKSVISALFFGVIIVLKFSAMIKN